MKISFTKAEAAHIYRDLKSVQKEHGSRNVGRESHDAIMTKLSIFLEVSFRGDKQAHDILPLFPAPEAGVDEH